jgi:L-threonylcarbamoyladenylate synthase
MKLVSTEEAVDFLGQDKVVAIPTETVYGLAANAFSETAVSRVFETKGRPSYNPLIVHIANYERLTDLVSSFPENAKILADKFWPGPLTLLLPKRDSVSDRITAGNPTVAIRMPSHPIAQDLLKKLDFPLVAPSANRFKHISPTKPSHVLDSLGAEVPIIDGGECKLGLESTIVGFDDHGRPVVYRQGTISLESLQEVLPETYLLHQRSNAEESIVAPGMIKRHYAPNTPLRIVDSIEKHLEEFGNVNKIGAIYPVKTKSHQLAAQTIALSREGDLNEIAEKLYAAFHQLDKQNLDYLIIERFENIGLGRTLNDKINRASSED